MLFDPDAGKTWKQICETVWQRLPPAKKAEIQALEAASGNTREEIIAQAVNEMDDRLDADPQARQRYETQLEYEKYPVGRDPRLRQEDAR